ncbi:unnamed protein product [Paramecium pentaurelia]|uniref:Uncharacterized protein n=1 Tax=Paramecium pentaurelia TaxID=43138 RepID=A0A8S1YKJ1_9CILI|nr:unnamed protein product [Paramecium pentaurelia]
MFFLMKMSQKRSKSSNKKQRKTRRLEQELQFKQSCNKRFSNQNQIEILTLRNQENGLELFIIYRQQEQRTGSESQSSFDRKQFNKLFKQVLNNSQLDGWKKSLY